MQRTKLDINGVSFFGSIRLLGLAILVLAVSACGGSGGSGGSDDDEDIGISYVGNRNPAVITQANSARLTSNVVSTSGFGFTLGAKDAGDRAAASGSASGASLTETAIRLQEFTRRSLRMTGVTPAGRGGGFAARTEIDETEQCDSGSVRISGEVEDDLTGEVEIEYRRCRFGEITLNGRVIWQLHAVDQVDLVPTHSTFRIVALTITTPRARSTIGGIIINRSNFANNTERLELRNFIVQDNVTRRMVMASSLRLLLQYDDIDFPRYVDHSFQSGRIYDSTHGYVNVVSLQPLRYEDIDDAFPASGRLQLSAVGRLTVTALPGLLVQLSIDTDQPPDGVDDYSLVVYWDMLDEPDLPDDDLDDDNIENSWEVENGLDPLDPADARRDFDFDGFDNLAEFLADTDPNDPDSMPPLSDLWRPAPGSTPASGNFVYLESQAGDYIGGGETNLYTDANAIFSASSNGGQLAFTVTTSGSWSGTFQMPAAASQLEAGYQGQLQRHPFHDPVVGGLSWTGMGRGCNALTGWFIIDAVSYENSQLSSIDLRFGQHCESNFPALYGQIRWVDTPPDPPDPPPPPPGNLWQPAPGVTPSSGNYIYLESQAGDYIGQGGVYLYTDADAILSLVATGGRLTASVNGDESWTGNFQSPADLMSLQAGFFDNLERYPFHNPVNGGLSWTGEGRGCNTLDGWFVVDSVTYNGNDLSSIELRFEQHCGSAAPALNGKLVWDVNNVATPPGPENPPPAGLWQPPAGVTPTSGNYVYLESQAGDYIGAGGVYLYTSVDAILSFAVDNGRLDVWVNGDETWGGDFQAMNTLTRLEPGYYGELQRYPFHNPVRGGLSWSGEGRGCNSLTGWFVVDSVTYNGSDLSSIELRFEQHCESAAAPALNGKLVWDANNDDAPPGPVVPPPAGLWAAPAAAVPADGNYVYLESEPGDFIGQGGAYLYTGADAILSFVMNSGRLAVSVDGDESWNGDFQAMNILTRLEPGFYGDLQRYPFHNPTRGGLSWSGEGRGCNNLNGWFVVDSVTYDGTDLAAIDLRFEQRCGTGAPALNGQLHWDVNNSAAPAGPVVPPPAGLWQPAVGVTPASGNYVYLESQAGDFIGQGGVYLYTDADTLLTFNDIGGRLDVGVNGAEYWNGDFQAMYNLVRLEPGYYGNLQRYPFHNPARGGLSWTGEHRGCNRITGWFVVDSVTYTGIDLTAIELRFEQHCEGGAPALNGKLRWSQ